MSLARERPGVLFLAVALASLVLRAVYLLYLHPLASFRGPRRAALSEWWLYSVAKTGRPEEILEQLHRKYNTRALRIGPNELHLSDSTLYHTVYSQGHSFAKHAHFYDAFGTVPSLFLERDRDRHRQRRKALGRFFSKASIRGMQRLLSAKVEALCDLISAKANEGPVNFYNAARCMTVDIISDLSLGQSFNLMDDAKANDFAADYLHVFNLVAESIWDFMYIPLARRAAGMIPPALAAWIGGPVSHFARFMKVIRSTVARFKHAKATGKPFEHEVVLEALSELPDEEMVIEAVDLLVAGSDTTATTLAVALHQLARNQQAHTALENEIRQAKLETAADYDLTSLEQLPYLSACVKEALRFAMAVPGRLPRVVPPPRPGAGPLTVDGQVIPPGTVVGISAYTVHFDEKIWGADAREFRPERWLEPGAKELDKYLVTFSKGVRQCLGINLAYAELTLALAMLTARFDFTPDDTMSKEDVEVIDNFTAGFRGSGPRLKFSNL
ncbi:uncharacterized protein THITE_43879 [Thermothielavioides terrestris NRRL 8126]|uniref:Cytochrome P450 n=1 Tax=Thermothielavioides terrestris (strain ATCC 38088 / NRRL 8126) TaxID=578455 RepID=G2RBB3_THETT|nr:uncharacterized protein THITE_43879 [Thermothielavioides terrestris NRRL 8126]AEO69084.1 hypothetical protein THITE_43879 [Thermothielavioides terrestris NRRL 8126]